MRQFRGLRRMCLSLVALMGVAYLAERLAIWKWRCAPVPPIRRVHGTERYLTLRDSAQLRTVEFGEGPLVVLVHGIGGRIDHWAPIAGDLAAAGHRVVAYDQRGHARSERGTEPYTPDTLGQDLLEVIASTGSRAAVVAGHSLGGIAILGVLDHGLADAVDAVVLVSTVHKRIEPGGLLKAAAVAFLQLASHRTHGIVMMRPGFGRNPHFDDLDELRRNWAEFDGDTLADAAQGLAGFDYTDSLRSCALPTRVICGDADRVTPVKFSREIADLTPDAQLEVLSGVGHMATWEAPSTVVRHICESVYAVVI